MIETIENIPPDLRLIEELIIELKVSSRNIAIYPREHPAVRNSLNRVYNVFKKIFELRPGITFAVGKNTLFIENYSPDKKNLLYKQLSLEKIFDILVAKKFDFLISQNSSYEM